MDILDKTTSFIKEQTQQIYEDCGLDYWDNRSLSEGYVEATSELTKLVEAKLQSSPQLIQAMAGAGMGVAKLLGAIPIGLNEWAIQVAKEIPNGPGDTLYKVVEVPVRGLYHGAQFVVQQLSSWADNSLNNKNSFAIADEVTTTLGTAALLFLGGKHVVKGGRGIVKTLAEGELVPQIASGNTAIAAINVDVAALGSNIATLGQGTVWITSIQGQPLQQTGSLSRPEPMTMSQHKRGKRKGRKKSRQSSTARNPSQSPPSKPGGRNSSGGNGKNVSGGSSKELIKKVGTFLAGFGSFFAVKYVWNRIEEHAAEREKVQERQKELLDRKGFTKKGIGKLEKLLPPPPTPPH